MSNTKNNSKKILLKNAQKKFYLTDSAIDMKEFETDVLYQKIYGKWYAFSVVENDCLMAEVPEEAVKKTINLKTK